MRAFETILQFYPPRRFATTALREFTQAPASALHLPYAQQQQLLQWGSDGENNIHQQLYTGSGFVVGVIHIQISVPTLLELTCATSFNTLLYSLEGYGFLMLQGYGCLPLFQDSYTLHYVPGDRHSLFLPAGNYRYFLVSPGMLLANLVQEHAPVQELVRREELVHQSGSMAARQEITVNLLQMIQQFAHMPATNGNTALLVESKINDLLRYFHLQALSSPIDLLSTAGMTLFLASHLHLPAQRLIQLLKKKYFTTNSSLQRCWQQNHTQAFRSFVTQIRMQYALYLLVAENRSIAEVIEFIQYQNPSDFSRQFRKTHGFSPSAARQFVVF